MLAPDWPTVLDWPIPGSEEAQVEKVPKHALRQVSSALVVRQPSVGGGGGVMRYWSNNDYDKSTA